MQLIAYARNPVELTKLKESGAAEVILCHQELSRLGTLDLNSLHQLAREARALGSRPVLEWDILMTQDRLSQATSVLSQIDLGLFGAIRVQDPGAFEFALKRLSGLPIQLILETGNHNFEAIQGWLASGEGRIERLALSIELPKIRIASYIEHLPVPVELLGLGPILLLYTPRHLLSNQLEGPDRHKLDHPWLQALADSEESLHRGFRIIENRHGTLVFHAKDYCLLDRVSELHEMGLSAFRVDFRLEDGSDRLPDLSRVLRSASNDQGKAFIENHPNKVTRCFFQANATDVLFKKLKNTTVQRQDEGYIGEVVEIAKNSHTLIRVLGKNQSLSLGQKLRFATPEGRTETHTVENLRNLNQELVQEIPQGDYGLLPYLKFVTPKTAVYEY